MNPKTWGEHIRRVRMDREMFQIDVSKLLNVSEDTITFWENGRTHPQQRFHKKIIEFLGYHPIIERKRDILLK